MCKGRAKSDRAWISGVAASILAKRRLIARYARPAPGWGLTSTNFWILCTAYAFAFAFTPRKCWFSFYLRTPEARMLLIGSAHGSEQKCSGKCYRP